MSILGIIPARYASTRFPGKPLALIQGITMIQRVYDQSVKASKLDDVVVATDDRRIFDHVISFGGKAVMTSDNHRTGTERCAEVVQNIDIQYDAVINIQGDEPFINPLQINMLAELLSENKVQIATQIKKITTEAELNNPNVVKVVTDNYDHAIYFSRLPIPYIREHYHFRVLDKHSFYKHIGIYGYRTDVLRKIVEIEASELELAESLEQLRWIQNGYKIRVQETDFENIAIDTPEDLDKLQKTL